MNLFTRFRRIATHMVVLATLVACAAPGATAGPAPSPEPPVVQQLRQHQQQWSAQNTANYRYMAQVSCFCAPAYREPVMVEVRNGSTAAITRPEGQPPVDAQFFDKYSTVDDLFAVVQDAVDRNAADIAVEYDAASGVPTNIRIDYDAQAADEELYLTISSFEAIN